ncbi:NDR1/HIN1-like protein 6 [Phragmites australis]|uniref:NDR1/HIN1-like protein 6 n=1 Tax=Phragmites australis TaxID=29695 RepID=UPI002D771974|nr:NDR1/HIN1-like protein 6 [Phragmites australis]
MADHQRIHPVDLEAGRKPSAPLVPEGSFRSDKGDPAQRADHQQRRGYGQGHLPPPPRRVAPPVPPLPPPRRHRRGCCCRFICCIIVTVVVLAVLAAAAVGALYLVFDPKAPRYSVDRLSVSAFQVDPTTLTARAGFDVTVTATNPNARIGIYYEPGSSLGVWYESYRLARGALPAFYQGHRNTTVLALAMGGDVQLGSAVVTALQDAQRTGAVPLVFRADVPVRVELGTFKLWKVTSRVRCDLVVDRLMDVNSPIKIKASNCKFSLKL